jgi:enamine deaminase RidA (YjgF/YER057c/UK114 family)
MLTHPFSWANENFSATGFEFVRQDSRLCYSVASLRGVNIVMNHSPEARIRELGIVLPPAPAPGGNYLPAKTVGVLVYLSGVISSDVSGIIAGTVGLDRSIADGYSAARACALIQLAVLRQHLNSLDAVKSILSVNGYVNAVPGFSDSPKVINGASDLFVEIFGDAGRHVRAAVGVSALPRNALVELQMTVEI